MTKLSAELRHLMDRPVAVAGYIEEPTGQTFRQAWEERDANARRQLMRSAGYRLDVVLIDGHPVVVYLIDHSLQERAQDAASGKPVATIAPSDGKGYGREALATLAGMLTGGTQNGVAMVTVEPLS